ncbi:amino acid ABC transporter permease [Moritella marina ATCC 15381]|uniref:Putative glutamine transport system permease protein GlnP n=1 Tax=Moritella marina ATCC 15381 TaxID=1202962 RepID=A0A5J6WLF7_MORMI|nr:amino acid ABC transporter permease [Moritella marina]QFI38071.1 amino acid ABC transporter permease [Moritella marina ATCC 15381]
MHDKKHNWMWHLLSLLALVAVGFSIYSASQKIDYNWQWNRVVPYIIDTSPIDTYAEYDGTIVMNGSGLITVEFDNGEPTQVVAKADDVFVSDGDLVFEGDTVSSIDQQSMGVLLQGLLMTIKLSLISLFFAIIIGLVAALMRISINPLSRNFAFLYVEVIRGTPLLVQIFIVYFFLGTIFDLDRFTAGIAALSVFTGAYIAEIIRSGIQSISPGQMEAARSLGMSYPKAMIYVVLPQAFKRTLPPMAGQFINLIKDSSLVSVISITDLTKAGREVVAGSFATFEVWFTVAALYLVLTATLSFGVQRIEKRLSTSD